MEASSALKSLFCSFPDVFWHTTDKEWGLEEVGLICFVDDGTENLPVHDHSDIAVICEYLDAVQTAVIHWLLAEQSGLFVLVLAQGCTDAAPAKDWS